MNEYVPRECLTFSPAYHKLFVISAELHTVIQSCKQCYPQT